MRRVLPIVALCSAFAAAALAAPPRHTGVDANDLAWDAANGRVWASVRGSGAHENAVVALDPVTGEVVASIDLGAEAGPVAVSHDGTQLFAGVASVLKRVDLATLDVTDISLGSGPSGAHVASDVAVHPSAPDLFAVARKNAASPAVSEGVVTFASDQMHANAAPSGALRVIFNDTGTNLFGSGAAHDVQRMALDPSGPLLLSTRVSSRIGADCYDAATGWVIGAGGAYAPGLVESFIGTYAVPAGAGAIGRSECDSALGEVYRLTQRGIVVFERDSFVALGQLPLPTLQSIGAPFVR